MLARFALVVGQEPHRELAHGDVRQGDGGELRPEVLGLLSSWGQFLWPSLTTSDPAKRPLPLEMGVFSRQQPPDWGAVFAFGTLLVLPVLVLFLAFQRFFVESVASSGVKG